MKHYLNWALANLPVLSQLGTEQAEDIVHDAYYSAIGEAFVILFFLVSPPWFWLGIKLMNQYMDTTTAAATLAVLLGFGSAEPIDWYIKRRIAVRIREVPRGGSQMNHADV